MGFRRKGSIIPNRCEDCRTGRGCHIIGCPILGRKIRGNRSTALIGGFYLHLFQQTVNPLSEQTRTIVLCRHLSAETTEFCLNIQHLLGIVNQFQGIGGFWWWIGIVLVRRVAFLAQKATRNFVQSTVLHFLFRVVSITSASLITGANEIATCGEPCKVICQCLSNQMQAQANSGSGAAQVNVPKIGMFLPSIDSAATLCHHDTFHSFCVDHMLLL
mmetsp:Transcript_11712/g.26193  ORF Transcript_11712/g.26193 Transcript_11712/m.26193 type:complete len:216 (+) Transcript_11712:781-1428(+)